MTEGADHEGSGVERIPGAGCLRGRRAQHLAQDPEEGGRKALCLRGRALPVHRAGNRQARADGRGPGGLPRRQVHQGGVRAHLELMGWPGAWQRRGPARRRRSLRILDAWSRAAGGGTYELEETDNPCFSSRLSRATLSDSSLCAFLVQPTAIFQADDKQRVQILCSIKTL